MPGHGHAAINAMLARYRKYVNTDLALATEYLLTDLEDESDYISIQGTYSNVNSFYFITLEQIVLYTDSYRF